MQFDFSGLTSAQITTRLTEVQTAITSARGQQSYSTVGLSVARPNLALLYAEEAALLAEQQAQLRDARGDDGIIAVEFDDVDGRYTDGLAPCQR